jgi:hypothetical protein
MLLLALAAAGMLALACAPASRWRAQAAPRSVEVPLLLESDDSSDSLSQIFAHEVPNIPIRERLRPCCAFGSELQAKLGPIPVPFYRLSNLLEADGIGPHTYDSGLLMIRLGDEPGLLLNDERNGLVYTCGGGFIDTAHVRDYADWTLYLAAQVAIALETGTTIDLGEEGGARRVVLEPIPREVIEEMGVRKLALVLAQWLAIQMSLYHEIVTGFGWAAVPGFSELASSFSPEDLYSNVIGTKIAAAIVYRRHAGSERQYNANVGAWFRKVLLHLEAVPRDQASEAVSQLDGLWWDSSKRLPDPHLVRRRNFDFDTQLAPWLVPDALLTPELRETCRDREPVVLSNPDQLDEFRFSDFARLEIDVPEKWMGDEPWRDLGPRITQEDFPVLIAHLRKRALEVFGPRADRSD